MPIELMQRLARYFARRIHIRDNAVSREDLEQIAMIAMVKAWPKHNESLGAASTYLGNAARCDLQDYAAKVLRRPQAASTLLVHEIASHDTDPVDKIDMYRAVKNQRIRTRHIMSLVAQGYSNEEIGQQLGLTREAVRLILGDCTPNKKRPKRASARARAT
jgi:RNA polymerase sigma factor (sigma-70 family)